MNVLFVNNFRARGGGEEFLLDLLTGLAERGVSAGLVCRPGAPLAAMFQGTPVAVYPVKRTGWGMLTSVFVIARIIRRNDYRIVNIQRGHDILQAWAAAVLSGKHPVLLYTLQSLRFIRSRFLLGRMHAVITVSRYVRDLITRRYPAASAMSIVINHGIRIGQFRHDSAPRGYLRNRFGLSEKTVIIGTVGNLLKNQVEFLGALVTIRKEFPDARYALAAFETSGDPVEKSQIAAFKLRAQELGLSDAVLWAGRVPKEDMPAFYADIDIAVSSYREEGFGIWVLEALCMGRPVVALGAGGVRDSLEGCPAGVLVDGAGEMAAEIIRILKNKEVYERMSGAGPRWVSERFSRKRMVENYLRLFESLHGKKRLKR